VCLTHSDGFLEHLWEVSEGARSGHTTSTTTSNRSTSPPDTSEAYAGYAQAYAGYAQANATCPAIAPFADPTQAQPSTITEIPTNKIPPSS
tara:strand:+ start:357 stop:629 length:273 start_codon:yes stop_codon:yes gene_type:complete